MGYKILGYIVWNGTKWVVRRGASQAKRELVIAGASAGALALAGAGTAAALKRRRNSE